MKSRRTPAFLTIATAAGSCFFLLSLSARPPAAGDGRKPVATPAPAPAPGEPGVDPLARWLLQQNGQPDAIALPLGQVVHAATGRQVTPFDPTSPEGVAFSKWFSALMDRVLPQINRPDSPARAAARLAEPDEVAARVEDEIRTVARDFAAFRSPRVENADSHGRSYPALRLLDTTNGKTYYLAVTLHGGGGEREAAARALRFDPLEGRQQITADGCCLLVGIEYNGKLGGDIAFLNWDVVDVANLPVRVAVTFEAGGGDVYHPGAILTDGRKGSD